MPSAPETDSLPSPFHPGEQELQTRTGSRARMEAFGRKVIRPYMPDQHRLFFAQLPFLVVGSTDAAGWPWASIVTGAPGFATSPDPRRLDVQATIPDADPLAANLSVGSPLGLLGIELETRRRNRLNARVTSRSDDRLTLAVDQSFGNCPQYIQTRDLDYTRAKDSPVAPETTDQLTHLDAEATRLITSADTFFVASAIPPANNPEREGVDVSHRGGRSGFVKVDGNTLTIPDFPGNYHFNTLGNFLINPKAGLLFADFATGDLLLLAGKVDLLWAEDPEIRDFAGAERGWRFHLHRGIRLRKALPFRARFQQWSPNSLMADSWYNAAARAKAEVDRSSWRPLKVTRVVDESEVIRSFYLNTADGTPLPRFRPGQHLRLRLTSDQSSPPLIRSYTVSSAPADDTYRISVKREAGGTGSAYLHDRIQPGDRIEVHPPSGAFHLDTADQRPVLLLAGGVGITPMIAMARQALADLARTRNMRPITVFHAAKTTGQRAFQDEFRTLEQASGGRLRYISLISSPSAADVLERDYDASGHITADLLRRTMPLDDYEAYLCGPPGFMQAAYDSLRHLGLADSRIHAEAFGPARLQRETDSHTPADQPEEAASAEVSFATSGTSRSWSAGDGTLLDLAEAQGLTPDFSCRAGSCGSCATRLLDGAVTYRQPPTAAPEADKVLICCAVPAAGHSKLTLDL